MQGAVSRLAIVGAQMLLLASFPALIAREKEKTLFRVHESIFSFGRTEKRVLEVDSNGRVSLKVKYPKKSEALLNAAELRALRDFTASEAIQALKGRYDDYSLTMDCYRLVLSAASAKELRRFT